MTSYTIKAYPTVYKGRRYRSRLEARWAAFFDLLGIATEYEPYDIGKWSPDFLIRTDAFYDVLVEIKPITEFDPPTAEKIGTAARALTSGDYVKPTVESIRGGGKFVPHLLLLGLGPSVVGDAIRIGWWAHGPTPNGRQVHWEEAYLGWKLVSSQPAIEPEFYTLDGYDESGEAESWYSLIRKASGVICSEPLAYPEHTMGIWAQATSAVQYKRDGGKP